MGFADWLASTTSGLGTYPTLRYGVNVLDATDTEKGTPNVSSIYTCQKKLAENVSRIRYNFIQGHKKIKNHKYSKRLVRPNINQNRQKFWATVETHRLNWGNAFVDIRDEKNWEIIHPTALDDYGWENGKLRYHFDYKLEDLAHSFSFKQSGRDLSKKRKSGKEEEWIDAKDVLHFTGIGTDGVLGLSPIAAFMLNAKIQHKAGNTIMAFYNNRAVSPMAVESTIPSAGSMKNLEAAMEQFEEKYGGYQHWGKTVNLPPFTKLTPLTMQFADAQLIETLRFTRDEIASLYGIPQFMFNDVVVQSREIEQQSLEFRSFTIAPINEIYESEMRLKLLSESEELDEMSVEGDLDVFWESDLKNKVDAYATGLGKGVYSPDEVAAKMGTEPVGGEFGNKKFMQMQYIPIDLVGLYLESIMKSKKSDLPKQENNTETNEE